jgi:soluble lytic murein transglycosylase-like protein
VADGWRVLVPLIVAVIVVALMLFASSRDPVDRWKSLAEYYADLYNVPLELVLGVIEQESDGDPDALGDNGASHGLMQVQIPAAQDSRVRFSGLREMASPDPDILMTPRYNIAHGVAYLRVQFERMGNDWREALRAYNGGAARAKREPGLASGYADSVLKRSERFA